MDLDDGGPKSNRDTVKLTNTYKSASGMTVTLLVYFMMMPSYGN
jgi:hypothetical protein